MAIDLNAIQAPGTPVTVTLTGSAGSFMLGDGSGFRQDWATAIGAAGLTPDAMEVDFDLFSTHYTAVITARTTGQTVTPFQVLYVVQHTCPVAVDSATVTAVGNPGDVVSPPSSSIFDPITQALAKAFGLDVKSVGSSISAALQLAVVIILVIGAFWLYHLSQ